MQVFLTENFKEYAYGASFLIENSKENNHAGQESPVVDLSNGVSST